MGLCGIDLGTTFSCIAYYDIDIRRVEVIPDQDMQGQFLIPSAVYFPETGDPKVGWTALNMAAQDPDRLVRWIKMNMGTDFKKKIGNREYTPEEVSAEILKKLKHNAEVFLNEDLEGVVITVPAYFGDRARFATKKAAELAGLKLVRLLAEPSAAALAYVIDARNIDLLSGEKNVLVSDLGGGTYDVTLLQTQPKKDAEGNSTLNINILCKEGSQELGGKLWDDALEDYLVAQCIELGHTENPKSDARLAYGLRERVIKGKEMLSTAESIQIICDMGNFQEVNLEKFNELTAPLLLQVETKLRTTLEQAEQRKPPIPLDAIDPILLVGGASRMSMISRMVENVTGKHPLLHPRVDLLVAIGAAYDVCIASGEGIETRSGGIKIITPPEDIARMAVGVKALKLGKDINAIVIEANSPFETEFSRDDLVTASDNQETIDFEIYEGDIEDLTACKKLATISLSLPPNQPMGTPVKVILKYNNSGIIVGSGICYTTEGPKEVPIEIDRA